MSASEGEEGHYHHFFSACRICGGRIHQPIKVISTIVINGLVFCPEHAREFKRRRRNGVSTAQLDTIWGDTLRNWSERPPELNEEAKMKLMATSFVFREKYEPWLIFERSYYRFSLPHSNKSSGTIHNPQKDFWWRFRWQKSSPRLHRFSDYIAINKQAGEVRRFVDVALNEVLDDLQGIRSAPAQAELAPFWGKRRPSGIRERTRGHVHQRS